MAGLNPLNPLSVLGNTITNAAKGAYYAVTDPFTGQDHDIIPGASIAGGVRNPSKGNAVGITDSRSYYNAGGTVGNKNDEGAAPSNSIAPSYNPATAQANAAAAEEARQKSITLGNLDQQIAQYQGDLNNLGGARSAATNAINDAYNKNLSRLNETQSSALSKYATKRSDTQKTFQDSLGDIQNGAYNNYNALQQLLGRAGSGSSSAAKNVVPYAVSQDASKSRAGVADSYGMNMRDLKDAEDETKLTYKNSVADLGDQRRTSLGNLDKDIQGKQAEYNNTLAELAGQRAQAAGGDWKAVQGAMQSYVDRRNAINKALSTLTDKYRNPYSVKGVTVKDPTMRNYTTDINGVAVQSGTADGNTDTSADYLAQIRAAEDEKKKNQAGVIA